MAVLTYHASVMAESDLTTIKSDILSSQITDTLAANEIHVRYLANQTTYSK